MDISRILTPASPPRDRRKWELQHALNGIYLTFPGGYDAKEAKSIEAYMRGDNWQDGKYWMGAGRLPGGLWQTGDKERVQAQFTAVPEGTACLAQRVHGACGNEADFSLQARNPAGEVDEKTGKQAPSEEQAAFIEEWERDTGADWTDQGIWGGTDIRKPTGVRGMVALASAHHSGSACIRAFFNPESRTEEARDKEGNVSKTIPQQPTRADAYRHIPIVAPPPDRCCVYEDPDTKQTTGIFLFSDEDNKQCAEIWFGEGEQTIYRLLREGAEPVEQPFPWGGLLPIVQANIGTLWTPAVLTLQRQLDTDATATGRTVLAQAYGQRTEINAEEDGAWMLTPPAGIDVPRFRDPPDGGPRQYFNPRSAELGPGINRRLIGIPYTTGANEHGETTALTTPSVHDQPPTSPEASIQGLAAFIVLFRDACHQGHRRSLLGGSTAEASGDAYEQARAAFLADIKGVAESVDACVAALLTIRTIMADTLCRVPDPFAFARDYAVIVQSHPDAGAPTSESQANTRENVRARLISPEEGTARLNVQNVAVEHERIRESSTLDSVKQVVDMLASAASAGVNPKAVLLKLGWSEEEADAWMRTDLTGNVEQ